MARASGRLRPGYDTPQLSIHRGKLPAVLARAAFERLGADRIHIGCALAGFDARGSEIVARLRRRDENRVFEVAGDALIGCDSIHSAVRAGLYPNEETAALGRHHVVARRRRLADLRQAATR